MKGNEMLVSRSRGYDVINYNEPMSRQHKIQTVFIQLRFFANIFLSSFIEQSIF